MKNGLKVALVHDYLREYGGAERVVEALHRLFPDAPLYVAFYDKRALGSYAQRFAGWEIRQTPFSFLPLHRKLFSPYRVFSAWAFEQLDLSEFDVVISSTNMFMAKAVKTQKNALHISYIHTPSRSLYGFSTRTDWKKNPMIRVGGELLNIWMRYIDFKSAQNPQILVANSQTTKERIAKFYRRDAVVVPPPIGLVDEMIKPAAWSTRKYLLFVGRLVFSKHPELAIEVAKKTGLPLKIAGVGPMLAQLKELAAGHDIEFLEDVSDEALRELYARARLLLYPAEDEDFGMVPIEAMAVGTPVIGHYSGEPRFTIKPEKNGSHVRNFEVEAWSEAVQKAWKESWDVEAVQRTVMAYSEAHFHARIRALIEKA